MIEILFIVSLIVVASWTFELGFLTISSFVIVFLLMGDESLLSSGVKIWGLSSVMIILTLFLSLICLLPLSGSGIDKMVLSLSGVVIPFFLTENFYVFFVTYEMSLVPLLIIVVFFGNQPERLTASKFMFLYTIVSSSFLLFFFVEILEEFGSSMELNSLKFNGSGVSHPLFFVSVLTFFVNIPVFMFHSWLPKAHVEAPLEGSILLAGVMLNVGMYGLIRFLSVGELSLWISSLVVCISVIGALYSGVLSVSSDDMNISVAYSSVSHMNLAVGSLLVINDLSLQSSVVVMFSHGLISPLLFYLVTSIYRQTNSRSILISNGVLSNQPFLSFVSFILWSINLSTPPFFSFYGELFSFIAILSFCSAISVILTCYLFVSSFFSIMMFGVMSHSSFKLSVNPEPEDFFLPLSSSVCCVMMLGLFVLSGFTPI